MILRAPLLFILLLSLFSCKNEFSSDLNSSSIQCDSINSSKSEVIIRGALLASRINSMEELRKIIKLEYFDSAGKLSNDITKNTMVRLTQCIGDKVIVSELKRDISQSDIAKARDGNIWKKVELLYTAPSAVAKRMELTNIFTLARWNVKFGFGDVAFYNLAETALRKINTPELAFKSNEDSLELGYINSFNHITAQALITSCYSEELADFIADMHERYNMPELVSGNFTAEQLSNHDDNPVDNYVDMINNEWGQEIGKELKKKYNISMNTHWTPELLANYLNDLQSYYSWFYQIGLEPFGSEEEVVIRFSEKINLVIRENQYL